jgi:acyl-CoA dehydrogenase
VEAPIDGPTVPYCRQLTRYSASFALLADATLAMFGGALKRREKISGRFADALAWMYLASAAMKRFYDDGSPISDRPLLRWSCELAFWNIEQALKGILDNLPNRFMAFVLKTLIFPRGARRKLPGDALGGAIAQAILDGGETRNRLTQGIFAPPAGELGLGLLESALDATTSARPAAKKLSAAKELKSDAVSDIIERALNAGIIDSREAKLLNQASLAEDAAIQVDAYNQKEYEAL